MTSNGFNEDEIKQKLAEAENEPIQEIQDFRGDCNPIFIPTQNLTFDSVVERGLEIKKKILDDTEVPQVRPWVRLMARAIDGIVWDTILYFTFRLLLSGTYLSISGVRYFSVFSILWILLEAVLISTWGFTPGKWILNVDVREKNGRKLTFSRALQRSFFVWIFGNGCSVIYLGTVANIFSYFYLNLKGDTWYDRKGGFDVSHRKIGVKIALIAVAAVTFMLVFKYYMKRIV